MERLIWLIIFAFGTFLAGYMSYEGYDQWKNNQVLTSLKTTGKFILNFTFEMNSDL